MSEAVPAAPKAKKIAKATVGRQVRLWVRAKFLSFRRYTKIDSDQDKIKTPIKPSSDLKESTIALLLNTTSERESLIFTKPTLEKPKTDLEYLSIYTDHLGTHQYQPRKHWSRFGKIFNQPTRKSHRFNS
jgi:hypothetical protein